MCLKALYTVLVFASISTFRAATQAPSPACARNRLEQNVLFNHNETCTHRPACALDGIEAFTRGLPLDSRATTAISSILQVQSGAHGVCSEAKPTLSKRERATLACDIGRLVLKEEDGGWVGPASSNYIDQAENNWSATCQTLPRCIFSPSTALEVGRVLKIARFVNATFAIRSGGSNPNRGWANTDGEGLLIDLHRLNKIELSNDNKTVKVGPGNRWLPVYQALEEAGVTVLGGRTPTPGVGGVLLGGGIPNFASEYGMACDMVDNFEVVLANSTVVNANPNENSDLFWGLKGGSANFGIVTEFTLRTVPIDKIWFEARLYHHSYNERILEAIAQYEVAAEKDDCASFAFSLGNDHTFVAWIYSRPVEYPEVFNMFYGIPYEKHFTNATIGTTSQFTASLARVLGPPIKMRRAIVSVATRPDNQLYQEVYKKWRAVADDFYHVTGAGMTMGIQPFTTKAVLKGKRNGGNALNLSPIPQEWFTAVAQWTNPKHDLASHSAVQAIGDHVRATAKRMGLLLDFVFLNDANFDQNPIASYGPKNVAKLQAVSKKYDPDQVFQILQNDGFLLRKT